MMHRGRRKNWVATRFGTQAIRKKSKADACYKTRTRYLPPTSMYGGSPPEELYYTFVYLHCYLSFHKTKCATRPFRSCIYVQTQVYVYRYTVPGSTLFIPAVAPLTNGYTRTTQYFRVPGVCLQRSISRALVGVCIRCGVTKFMGVSRAMIGRQLDGTDGSNADQKQIHLPSPVLGMSSDDQEERGPHSTCIGCEVHCLEAYVGRLICFAGWGRRNKGEMFARGYTLPVPMQIWIQPIYTRDRP